MVVGMDCGFPLPLLLPDLGGVVMVPVTDEINKGSCH